MSNVELLHVRLRRAEDAARVRQHVGLAARVLDIDPQEANRLATTVSEVCRAGAATGTATVSLRARAHGGHLLLSVELVCPDGTVPPGLRPGGAALAVVTRLMDEVEARPAGLLARKLLSPWGGSERRLEDARAALLVAGPGDLLSDVQEQNDELTAALLAVRDREAELRRLNDELEQTNRDVVALYAQLEQRAEQVRRAQRIVFEELEGALRPRPPAIADVELDVRYLPAEAGSPTGGDLYDWFVLRDGRLHVTVVDVLGHGVTSTRDALLVTHAVRTLVLEGHELGEVLARANRLLQGSDDEVVATVLLAQLDPPTGILLLAGGGHPPALLVPRVGDATYLEASGRPVGYPLAGSDEVTEHQLHAGDLVLLYTDGLIEVRKDVVEGLDTLQRAGTARAGSATAELLDGLLLDTAQGAAFNDDTLLLSLGWRPGPGHEPKPAVRTATSVATGPPSDLEMVLFPGPRAAAQARREVRQLCTPGVPDEILDDLILIVSELVANAACDGASSQVELHVDLGPDSVRLGVSDTKAGRPVLSRVDAHETNGRGLMLVETLASSWGVEERPPGKQVWARLSWRPAGVRVADR
ncbi:MAG: ATP-binding SpoIIE family protein phosphatase [Actinomycetes bacterium]